MDANRLKKIQENEAQSSVASQLIQSVTDNGVRYPFHPGNHHPSPKKPR